MLRCVKVQKCRIFSGHRAHSILSRQCNLQHIPIGSQQKQASCKLYCIDIILILKEHCVVTKQLCISEFTEYVYAECLQESGMKSFQWLLWAI